jgi:hypothetical protein
MRKCGLCICELRGGRRIAVEREDAPRLEGAGRHRVIEVLSRRIAIDLDRDAALSAAANTASQLATTPARDPVIRPRGVGKHPDRRVRDRGQHAPGLIRGPSEPCMRRGQDDVEGGGLIGGEIQPASGVDVRLNSLEQPEVITVPSVDLVDGVLLLVASPIDIPPAIFSPYE